MLLGIQPGDIFASVVRTAVPFLVGWLLAVPVIAQLGVDAEQVTNLVQFVVTTAYYVVFRWLETHVDVRFGWLLGLAKPPAYDQGVGEDVEPLEGDRDALPEDDEPLA